VVSSVRLMRSRTIISEHKLKAVVATGSQFVDMPTTVTKKSHLPDLAFLQRTILARIQVSIDGQQLKKNGAPNLREFGVSSS
jgi:hypothetical protein